MNNPKTILIRGEKSNSIPKHISEGSYLVYTKIPYKWTVISRQKNVNISKSSQTTTPR